MGEISGRGWGGTNVKGQEVMGTKAVGLSWEVIMTVELGLFHGVLVTGTHLVCAY